MEPPSGVTMWHLLPTSKQVLIIVALAILLAWASDGLYEWLHGQRAPLLKFVSVFAMIITIGVAGRLSLTWRCVLREFSIFSRKKFSRLSGYWGGTLVGTRVDPS